ncbi:hypothetical protein BJV78DRAFT_1155849 [Lactifluus subvellereus]|nr:hypothetical protein BJV78DRAFT_1155849 [Lactifluus subvellereus]
MAASPTNTSSPCIYTGCEKTYGRPQDLKRHIVNHHLPYSIFCASCYWRCGREEELTAHSKNYHPGQVLGLSLIYDTRLVLGYIFDGSTALDVAERFALRFVAERAVELGTVEVWNDLCGRRARFGHCHCT